MNGEAFTSDAEVTIIGGGAAGLATAIFAARRRPQRSIVLLDGARKLGAKILVSGGGRCNVTNRQVRPVDFWGGSRNTIKRVLSAFTEARTVAFFQELGVDLHEEEHGKLFPDTHKARTVLDALLDEARRCGVRILTEHRVTAIERGGAGFHVVTPAGAIDARRIVLATGGRSLPKTGSDGGGYALAESLGHTLVPTTPALAPLVLDGDFHRPLSGIAQDVELCIHAAGDKPVRVRGAMLWTHFGVSGPAALDASRHWHRARLEGRDVRLTASFLPAIEPALAGLNLDLHPPADAAPGSAHSHSPTADFAALEACLRVLATAQPKAQLHNALARLLPARVADAMLDALEIPRTVPMAHLAKDVRRRLARALVEWPLPVRDSRGYAFAEVTAGGVLLSEVSPKTMESRVCPGLHLVGEILDVDGRIGGFNFQWAWSSAYVAAEGLEERSL